MSNQKTFCNVPWAGTHIYWDGSYGVCCAETHKPYIQPSTYDVKHMGIVQWYNSDVMKGVRDNIRSGEPLSQCSNCYKHESHQAESKRIRENFKSAIFTEKAFDKSYKQSPWYDKFESEIETIAPRDWQIDLGNECNLSCKMCNPQASSQIAQQYKKWNIYDGNVQINWALDQDAWSKFLTDIVSVENLNRIHFMGGEVMISKRFVEFLRHMVDKNKTDVSISLVSNGTKINHEIITLLHKFKTFDIEISIESIHDNNHYIRQGSVTSEVIANIEYLKSLQSEQFHLVLRTVPQLLSINNYDDTIRWAVDNQVPIESVVLTTPPQYQISVLPRHIKDSLIPKYKKLLDFLYSKDTEPRGVVTGRIASAIPRKMITETLSLISMLESPEPDNVEELRFELIKTMKRWDTIYGYDALEIYPEYKEFFVKYGY